MAAFGRRTYRVTIPVAGLAAPLWFRIGADAVWHPYVGARDFVHEAKATTFTFDNHEGPDGFSGFHGGFHCETVCKRLSLRRVSDQTRGVRMGARDFPVKGKIKATLLAYEPVHR